MDQEALAREIADAVVHNTKFWIALIGLVGAIIGAVIAVAGNLVLHWVQARKENKLDVARAKLLMQMLEAQECGNYRRLEES